MVAFVTVLALGALVWTVPLSDAASIATILGLGVAVASLGVALVGLDSQTKERQQPPSPSRLVPDPPTIILRANQEPSPPSKIPAAPPRRLIRRAILTAAACVIVGVASVALRGEFGPQRPGSPPKAPEAIFNDPIGKGIEIEALSPNGKTVASSYCTLYCGPVSLRAESSVSLSNLTTGAKMTIFRNQKGLLESAAFNLRSNILAVGDVNGYIYLWNLATDAPIAPLRDPDGMEPSEMAFTPKGDILATANDNGLIYLWNIATRTVTATLHVPTTGQAAQDMAFSPDGGTLAVGARDNGVIYLWKVARRTITATLLIPGGNDRGANGVNVAFNPDGRTLATADEFSHIYLWKLASRSIVATLHDPTGPGTPAEAFSPDGNTLAVANADAYSVRDAGNVYLWNLISHKITATLHDPHGTVANNVTFSLSSDTLAIGDANARTYLWDTSWLGS